MIEERWDYFAFMRIYAAGSLLLCKNFPLFFWSLNPSLNSLKLYFALLHSRSAAKNRLQVCELLVALALGQLRAAGTWGTVTLG